MKIKILVPIYNDWQSVSKLIDEIDNLNEVKLISLNDIDTTNFNNIINKNKEVEVKYLDLDTVYNTETPDTEIEQFIKDNEENLKEEVIDFSYAKITPSNLIDSDEFNNEFFKKIDEIENSILNDSNIEDIKKIYDLKLEYLNNYNNEVKNNLTEYFI